MGAGAQKGVSAWGARPAWVFTELLRGHWSLMLLLDPSHSGVTPESSVLRDPF